MPYCHRHIRHICRLRGRDNCKHRAFERCQRLSYRDAPGTTCALHGHALHSSQRGGFGLLLAESRRQEALHSSNSLEMQSLTGYGNGTPVVYRLLLIWPKVSKSKSTSDVQERAPTSSDTNASPSPKVSVSSGRQKVREQKKQELRAAANGILSDTLSSWHCASV